MKIFICEQDPYKAKLMQDILGVYNYKIVTIQKESDFFKEAQQQKPAVVIMNDIFWQDDILSRLRTDPATSKIPVIFIGSAFKTESEKRIGFDGLTEFLPETFKIKNLRHYIDRWTTLRSLYIRH